MPDLREGNLVFTFRDATLVGQVDRWAFYRNRFSSIPGTKAVDFVYALEDECWLIEVKDYRVHLRTKSLLLCDEVALKARDTLAVLAGARHNANDEDERSLARRAFRGNRWRVVLHLEDRPRRTRAQHDRRANLKTKLKRLLRGIDPHPVIGDVSDPRGPWSVANAQTT